MTGRSPAITGRRRGGGRGWSKTSRVSYRMAPRSPSPASPARQAEPLPPGSEVEVRVDADGFYGSWFEAVVKGFVPSRGRRCPARYTVTYTHLLSEKGANLVEPFAPSHVRPRPPRGSSEEEPFQLHDIVEAFHNDGWWSGIVLATEPLTVAFPITREVITFPHDQVRPRRDYVDGQWVQSQVAMVIHPRLSVRVYKVGDKVEVVRDREVYGYSWFPATVVKVIDILSYLVEYFDLEEGEGGGKAVEYLHWQLIRPAVEHFPRESEFQLGPGAAVEAYCDGAWSPGVVSRVVGEGEYEVSIDGKDDELLLRKVRELLKPRYKWNGKLWKIVSPKRQGNRWQSSSGKRPSSPVIVASSGDEHEKDPEFSATKRSRKELQQQEVTLTEGPRHMSETEMDTPLSAFCKSPSSNHSQLSEMSNFQVLSHTIVSSCSIPMKGLLDASSGHPTPQNESRKNAIEETVVNQEILSDMLLSECQIDSPVCGTSSVELPVAELLKQKMASSESDSAVQQTQERPLSVQALQVKKHTSKHKQGKMRPILALEGKNDISDNVQIQLKGNNDFSSKEIICALNACIKRCAPSAQIKQLRASDVVSRGSNTKVLASKKLTKKKNFKESSSPHDLLDATSTVQQRGRNKVAAQQKESSTEGQLEMRGPCTRRQLNRTLEDKMNVNEASDEELLPIIPPGFESTSNGKGSPMCSADGTSGIGIHSSLLDEDLSAAINGICQADQNADALTEYAASQEAEINDLMENSILSLDRSVQQDGGGVNERPMLLRFQNAGSSQFTIDNTLLRRCLVAASSIPPHLPLCQISNQKVLFMKTSPAWSVIEAMEVFQKVPQRPHFLPLQQFMPTLREGMALGLMVSYASLVESIKRSRMEDSTELFEQNISTLNHLEENGFNVQILQSSLSELLKIKSDYTKYLEDEDKLKERLHGEASAMSQIDALLDENNKAISQLEQKLKCLRRKTEEISRNKEEKAASLSKLKEEGNIIQAACGDAKQLFYSVVAELR